jgi:hypothetical protein
MSTRTKAISAAAFAAALAIAGGGAALAASTAKSGTANGSKQPARANGARVLGLGFRAFAFHRGPGDKLSAAAGYLGVTQAQLLTQLQSGKTLAQIANATQGKSAAGLVDALVAAEKKELADAVAAGRLTQAQADAIGAGLKQRITDFVNGTAPRFGFGGPHGDRGPGPSFGFRRGGFSSGGSFRGFAGPAASQSGAPTI